MHRKGFANIIVIVFIIAAASIALYFSINQENSTTPKVSNSYPISTSQEINSKNSLATCLPQNINLDSVVSIDVLEFKNGEPSRYKIITVEQKLTELNATCESSKLSDSSHNEIYFYQLTGCWGAAPHDYQEILEKQREEINNLKKQYTVIEMTCNPSGRLIY